MVRTSPSSQLELAVEVGQLAWSIVCQGPGLLVGRGAGADESHLPCPGGVEGPLAVDVSRVDPARRLDPVGVEAADGAPRALRVEHVDPDVVPDGREAGLVHPCGDVPQDPARILEGVGDKERVPFPCPQLGIGSHPRVPPGELQEQSPAVRADGRDRRPGRQDETLGGAEVGVVSLLGLIDDAGVRVVSPEGGLAVHELLDGGRRVDSDAVHARLALSAEVVGRHRVDVDRVRRWGRHHTLDGQPLLEQDAQLHLGPYHALAFVLLGTREGALVAGQARQVEVVQGLAPPLRLNVHVASVKVLPRLETGVVGLARQEHEAVGERLERLHTVLGLGDLPPVPEQPLVDVDLRLAIRRAVALQYGEGVVPEPTDLVAAREPGQPVLTPRLDVGTTTSRQ